MNRFMFAAMIALTTFTSGCSHEEDDHADHYMEHFVPEHKPANFAAAVDALRDRTGHLKYHIGETEGVVVTELTELSDIIGWIPELAADSDLNEADWTTARDLSLQMTKAHEELGLNQLESLLAALSPQIEQLEPLIERAGKPEPAITHDHDHGHDHDHHHDDAAEEE